MSWPRTTLGRAVAAEAKVLAAFADEALMTEMVDVLYRYVGDVLEGMDLIYNSASGVKDKTFRH